MRKMAILTTCLVAVAVTAQAAPTLVHSKFGGQIFGFDIDQAGTEGILSEAKFLQNGEVLAAAETFDQATGKILRVLHKMQGNNDYLTLGVTGASIGLVEHEIVGKLYVRKRVYEEVNPLTANAFTGTWTPKLTVDDLVLGISRVQGSSTTAVLAYHNKNDGKTFVFGANVAANTEAKSVALKAPAFGICCGPQIAYDATTNQAVVASSTGEVGGPPPVFALANLTTGALVQFNGLPGPAPYRSGFINGLAVDSADGIACTATELDFSVQFYDLAQQTGFAVVLPGATSQLQSGADVEFDPVNKLFFVAQPVSSTASSGSSIQVFDTTGKLVKSLNGFNFSNDSNVVPVHIGLNPATRTGYVNGPDAGVTELQAFSY